MSNVLTMGSGESNAPSIYEEVEHTRSLSQLRREQGEEATSKGDVDDQLRRSPDSFWLTRLTARVLAPEWAAPIIAAIPPSRDESIEAAKLASERALKLKKVDARRPGTSIPHCTH